MKANETPSDLVIAPEYMTFQKAQDYCQNVLNGTLFEPRSVEDVNLLHRISTKYGIQDLWVGMKATDYTTFPRDSNHWRYLSSTTVGINEEVFAKIVQDNGQNYVGKFLKKKQSKFKDFVGNSL